MRLTTEKAREMPIEDVIRMIRTAATMQWEHRAITYEHGVSLVTLIATRGDEIADALEAMTRQAAMSAIQQNQTQG